MKKYLFVSCLFCFLACSGVGVGPKTVQGTSPYETIVKDKMVLLDMGYVEGTINNKKVHAYRVAYSNGIGVANDHIYVLEDSGAQINIVQPEGKTVKHISVIVDNDTFKF